MSTATPPRSRPWPGAISLPAVRDVRAPGWVTRRPAWLVGGVVLVLLLAISAVLRTRQFSGPLWFEEGIAVGIASRSFGGVLHAAYVGGSAPLYYLLLHFWVNTVGSGEAAVRGLSLLFALLAIPVAGWAGWSLAGPRAAFYGAIVFAFGATLTTYAEQALPLTLLIVLSLVAVTAFLHAFAHRRRQYLVVCTLALVAALYTHFSAGLLLFGMLVAFGVIVRCAQPGDRRALVRDGLLCLGGVVLLFVPWLPATIHQILHATSPWHYVPLTGASIPGQMVGGERVDAALAAAGVIGLGPMLLVRSRRRTPEAVACWALATIVVAGLGLAAIGELVTTVWTVRFFAPLGAALLLLGALAAARAKVVGFAAILVYIACCANPGAFAPGHMSNVNQINAQLGPRLHTGDLVVVAQPEQAPLADYYLPSGLRYATTLGATPDPGYMDWDDALSRLRATNPRTTLAPLIASLRPGQRLLYIRPLTEGVRNWKSPWASLVQLRAAQWGQLLTEDVDRGVLIPLGTAPNNYLGSCCVANSAVLYRKAH